jgi:integrase
MVFGKIKTPAVKHHPALPYSKAPAFMARLRTCAGVAALALEFTVLTAARTGETLGARWSEMDFDKDLWTIPKDRMKAGQAHIVPLTKSALAVLNKLKELRVDDFVFPSSIKGTPISNAAMAAVLRRFEVEDAKARGEETHERVAAQGRKATKLKAKYIKPAFTVHGFRSTFRDWAGDETDIAREVAEAALAHAVGSKVEASYRRASALEKRRHLMEIWDVFLGGEQ